MLCEVKGRQRPIARSSDVERTSSLMAAEDWSKRGTEVYVVAMDMLKYIPVSLTSFQTDSEFHQN